MQAKAETESVGVDERARFDISLPLRGRFLTALDGTDNGGRRYSEIACILNQTKLIVDAGL